MTFVDTHTHLCDEAFRGEEETVIGRALAAGVARMLQPDVDSLERESMFALCRKYPDVLRPMLGLYPGSVKADWQEEIDRMLAFANESVVAIGEIGLDYHWDKTYMREQKEALSWQLEYASRRGLPVNIHLRDATGDFLDVLEAHKHLELRGSMHAFSGSYETFRRLQKLGDWYIGVGGVVTFKNASLAEAVRKIPLERIVLETDAPYLTPVPHRGKRNESSYIPLIAARIADLKGIRMEEVARTTTNNAKNLFGI